MFVGVLDLKTGRLLYCNGGHNPPLLISDKVVEMSCDPNLVVGIMPGFTFVAEEITLSHGTTVFLFTDGLNEAENAAFSQFGDKRIHDVATSAVAEHITKPADLVRHMDDAVRQFVGTAEHPESFNHGTSKQRMKWFKLGLETGDISKGNTFQCSDAEL